jgi:hypothetical protein
MEGTLRPVTYSFYSAYCDRLTIPEASSMPNGNAQCSLSYILVSKELSARKVEWRATLLSLYGSTWPAPRRFLETCRTCERERQGKSNCRSVLGVNCGLLCERLE